MSTSVADTTAVRAWCDDDKLWVALKDGRVLGVPLGFFPRLTHATPAERREVELSGGGSGLHWVGLDEDISVAGLLEGRSDETRFGRDHRSSCALCDSSMEQSRGAQTGD